MKRTFQPKTRQEQKEHGFMKRMKTRAGRNILKARRAKGRKKLSAQKYSKVSIEIHILLPSVKERKVGYSEKNKYAKKKL